MKEETARAYLLEQLRQGVMDARNAGEDVLELRTEDFERLGQEMGGWTASEVSALYKRLVRGGYVRQVRGETGFLELNGILQYAWVEDLTDEGLRAIGVLSDPVTHLEEAFRAAMQEVAESNEIPRDKKADVTQWIDRGIQIARTVQGAADIIIKNL